MKYKTSLVILITLIMISFISACTETQDGTIVSPTTVPRTTVTPTTVPSYLTPGPTQTIPAEKVVSVNIIRYPISPNITAIFSGGKGQFQIRDITVRVTRSDGVVGIKKLGHNVGDEVTFEGTKGRDRVEVTVMFITNDQYKIIDALYDYYSHA